MIWAAISSVSIRIIRIICVSWTVWKRSRWWKRRNLTQQKQKEAELLAVQEQLKLTDYEKIKSRLDYCMERLSVIPQEKEASARKRGELESGRKILEEKQRENQKITEKLQDKERNLAEKSIWRYPCQYDQQKDPCQDPGSNDVLTYGLHAWKENGEPHPGIEGFFRCKEKSMPRIRRRW